MNQLKAKEYVEDENKKGMHGIMVHMIIGMRLNFIPSCRYISIDIMHKVQGEPGLV